MIARFQMQRSAKSVLVSYPGVVGDQTHGDTMASDSPRRPSRCAGGVLVRAQAVT